MYVSFLPPGTLRGRKKILLHTTRKVALLPHTCATWLVLPFGRALTATTNAHTHTLAAGISAQPHHAVSNTPLTHRAHYLRAPPQDVEWLDHTRCAARNTHRGKRVLLMTRWMRCRAFLGKKNAHTARVDHYDLTRVHCGSFASDSSALTCTTPLSSCCCNANGFRRQSLM